jgi:hypothetical protein
MKPSSGLSPFEVIREALTEVKMRVNSGPERRTSLGGEGGI